MNKSPQGKKYFYLSMITPDTRSYLVIHSSLTFSLQYMYFLTQYMYFLPQIKPERGREYVPSQASSQVSTEQAHRASAGCVHKYNTEHALFTSWHLVSAVIKAFVISRRLMTRGQHGPFLLPTFQSANSIKEDIILHLLPMPSADKPTT